MYFICLRWYFFLFFMDIHHLNWIVVAMKTYWPISIECLCNRCTYYPSKNNQIRYGVEEVKSRFQTKHKPKNEMPRVVDWAKPWAIEHSWTFSSLRFGECFSMSHIFSVQTHKLNSIRFQLWSHSHEMSIRITWNCLPKCNCSPFHTPLWQRI